MMSTYERVGSSRNAEHASDSSDDDLSSNDEYPRTSAEIRQKDRRIFDDEEEVEKLLSGDQGASRAKGLFGRVDDGNEVRISDRDRKQYAKDTNRSRKPSRRKRKDVGQGEPMYEMEEGGQRSSGESSGESSEIDRQRLEETYQMQHIQRPRWTRLAGIHVVIVIAFTGLLYGAYRASRARNVPVSESPLILSNGTTMFAPTTILISLDGFRADFLQRDITPHLNALVQSGVSPQYMLPSFPSVTFPNHFTLVTGLYPESHGVVGNTFWDPDMMAEFYYTDPSRSLQPEWWTAEPLWETLEYAGVRTAIHMWPGSEAHIGRIEPAYVDRFDEKETLSNKVDRILGLLDLPGPDDASADPGYPRPQLIAAYVPNVDADGHLHGPNSTEIRQTIQNADAMIGDVVAGLEQRNLSNIVNIVVVSDHGMATTDTSRLIELDSIIDMDKIEHTDGWPLYGLRPKNLHHLDDLYQTLKTEADASGKFEVYLRDVDMPERYHFRNNKRIAPLWIVPTTGWAIVRKHEYEEAKAAGVYHPRGLHGYDHEHPLMRAIFIARGPAFPHAPDSKLEPFQNIEVYNIVCGSVGVEPKANNGTLRLPLQPVGLHDSDSPLDIPADPAPLPSATTVPVAMTTAELGSEGDEAVDRPVVQDGEDDADDDKDVNLWLDWITGKLDGIKGWASDTFGMGKDAKENDTAS